MAVPEERETAHGYCGNSSQEHRAAALNCKKFLQMKLTFSTARAVSDVTSLNGAPLKEMIGKHCVLQSLTQM
jgi:hypothetical protein